MIAWIGKRSVKIDRWFDRILDAKRTLHGVANVTPVLTSRTLNVLAGADVFLKCENFQRVGAFKFRGAYNALSHLSDDDRRRGVVTHSSGNHAQALALAGRLLDIRTVIVMPLDAPDAKRAATEAYGAEIVEYDPAKATREDLSAALVEEKGYHLVHPYDDPDVIAGQATAALELLEETDGLDTLLAPCGGGGLLSGSALACRVARPECAVIGVEPELADDATKSFRTGTLHVVKNPPTIADGTRTPSLGANTFPLVREHVSDMVTVSEEAIAGAVRFLFERMKLVVEPSGALGVAALLSGAIAVGGRIGVILSGGNIDRRTMAALLDGGEGAP